MSNWLHPYWNRQALVPQPPTWPLTPFAVGDEVADHALTHFMDFDRSMENMDQEMRRMRRQMDHQMRANHHQLHRQLQSLAHRPGSLLEHQSMTNPIQTDADGNRQLKCYFDMRAFKPEEVNVTLDSKQRCLQVDANHEVKDDQNRHYVKRHYSRHFYLPDDVNVDAAALELKSSMSGDGVLCIEAPLPKLAAVQAPPAATGQALPGPTPIAVKKI